MRVPDEPSVFLDWHTFPRSCGGTHICQQGGRGLSPGRGWQELGRLLGLRQEPGRRKPGEGQDVLHINLQLLGF